MTCKLKFIPDSSESERITPLEELDAFSSVLDNEAELPGLFLIVSSIFKQLGVSGEVES